jgi:hypothetical protein
MPTPGSSGGRGVGSPFGARALSRVGSHPSRSANPTQPVSFRPVATTSKVGRLFGFPNPVNEKAARVVAGGVVILSVAAMALIGVGQGWLLAIIALGFWARVLTGPTLSPLGQLATRLVAPRLGPAKFVAGPPKRFAQAMGVAFSSTAVLLWFGFGEHAAALVVMALLTGAAFLESVFGYCLGCKIFGLLMRAGWIPDGVCEACNDLSLRHPRLHHPVAI